MKKFQNIFLFTIIFFGIFGLAKSSEAATYYVSPTGSAVCASECLIGSPCSVTTGLTCLSPGDTLIFKDGTYTGGANYVVNINVTGTIGNWITLKSENKWGAKLDGQNNTTGFGINFGSNSGFIRIEDFEIYGMEWGGIWSNMEADNIYIYGNKIHHIGVWDGCPSYNYGRPGIFQGGKTQNYTYDSNIFYEIGRLPSGPYDGTCENHFYQHDHAIYLTHENDQTDNTLIINNIVYGRIAGWAVTTDQSKNVKIVNNVFAFSRGGDGGFITVGGLRSSGILIQNNAMHDMGQGSCVVKDLSYWYGTPASGAFIIKNNIINRSYSDSTFYERWLNGVGGYVSPSDRYIFDNNLEQDMLFTDIANNKFTFQPTSPAIDAGLDTDAPSYDYDSINRPQGSAYDIGAYEYIQGQSDTTPPAAPTGITVK